jgi:NRPS condensation-like uncharacterized protein
MESNITIYSEASMQKQKVTPDDVFMYVSDMALEEHKFISVKDVEAKFEIDNNRSRQILNSLVESGKLEIVYQNRQIKVYAPKEVIEQIVRTVKKPKWVESHALPNKEHHMKEKIKLDESLFEYERFEELLYLKNEPLEEPVMFTFCWLGFEVKRLPKGSFADLELTKDGFLAAVEVSGGNAGCPISEVRQLTDYFNKTLSEEQREIPHLLLLFNHFNDKDLKERKEPFAPEIRKAAKRYNITLATTNQLYEKIERVKSGEKTENIVKEIMEGKWTT